MGGQFDKLIELAICCERSVREPRFVSANFAAARRQSRDHGQLSRLLCYYLVVQQISLFTVGCATSASLDVHDASALRSRLMTPFAAPKSESACQSIVTPQSCATSPAVAAAV
jgi:hypothetical protein